MFEDDAQVYQVSATKKYGAPLIIVTIEWNDATTKS